ncbi:MAG: phytanoyl-CoA dioxygenase family protein [Coxiellaceae bacterium]|nr:phytanoyl-CoA dioxygenase family protein [Coxiellaceae bacterium]
MSQYNFEIIRESIKLHGYYLLEDFLSYSEFEKCRKMADELQVLPEKANGPMKYFEISEKNKTEILNRVENFAESKLDLCSQLFYKKIPSFLKNVFGNNFFLLKEKINFKMPGGEGFRAHQDAPAFTRFIKNEMLTFMIPVQSTNRENGCLQISGNYFKNEIITHENGTISNDIFNKIIWKEIPMNERDMLVFSSMLLHRSESNKSNSPRRSYFITYNQEIDGDLRREYFKYKREKFPPRIERDNSINIEELNKNIAKKVF